MRSTTVRISEAAWKVLRELAGEDGETMQAILEQAVEQYRRRRFLEGLNADYLALRNDPEAWQAELVERKLWESTLMDGLDPNEVWTEDRNVIWKEKDRDGRDSRFGIRNSEFGIRDSLIQNPKSKLASPRRN